MPALDSPLVGAGAAVLVLWWAGRRRRRELEGAGAPAALEAARAAFVRFHGHEPAGFVPVEVPDPTTGPLVALGRLHAVTYDPEGMPSSKAGHLWEHTFAEHGGVRPWIATDPAGDQLVTVRAGSRFHVDDWIRG